MGLIIDDARFAKAKEKALGVPAPIDTKSVEKPGSAGEKVQPKINNWDKTYQPIIEELGWQKDLNYGNSKHIMRAVNGKYDNAMGQIKTEDPALYKKFKDFKNNSMSFANELANVKSTGNTDNLNKYHKSATLLFSEISAALDPAKNKKWAVDAEANVMSRKQYEHYNQSVEVGENSSISANMVFDQGEFKANYETWGTSAEYNKLKNVSTGWQKQIEKKSEPIVSSWVATSLKNIDSKDATKSKDNNLAWNLNVDLLRQVSEHGTIDDPNRRKLDKDKASAIRKQMWGKDYQGQLDVLKENSDIIQGMSKRMGFHGTTKILNTHRDTVGKLNDYFPETTDKTRADFFDDMDDIKVMQGHYKEFKEVDKNFRNNALGSVKNNRQAIVDGLGLNKDFDPKLFNMAMDALVDKSGNILSFESWKKTLRSQNDPTGHGGMGNVSAYGSTFKQGQTNPKRRSALGQIWEENKTGDWDNFGQYFHGQHSQEGVQEDLVSIYSGLTKGYKKEFSKIKASQVYQSSLLKAGFGDLRNQTLVFKGIDLSVDKDHNLLSTTSPKQANVNKLIGLMRNAEGQITDKDITLFSNEDVNAGLNSLQKSDLTDHQKNNPNVAKDFFKGDMKNVTMEFYRNTNVPGQAAYMFYNTATKKKMAMYVPTKSLMKDTGVGEDMYVNTARSPRDFVFQAKGYKDMPVLKSKGKPAYESARLTFDNDKNAYIGTMTYWNQDGNKQTFEHVIPMGHAITIKGATDNFNSFLSQYSTTL